MALKHVHIYVQCIAYILQCIRLSFVILRISSEGTILKFREVEKVALKIFRCIGEENNIASMKRTMRKSNAENGT